MTSPPRSGSEEDAVPLHRAKNVTAGAISTGATERLRAALEEGADRPPMEALRHGVVESSRDPADQEPVRGRG